MHRNQWRLLPNEVQDAHDLPPVRFDGIHPAYGPSPAQAQFTIQDHNCAAHSAVILLPLRSLSVLGIKIAFAATVQRFESAQPQEWEEAA